jgi:hypothetical protein
MTDKEKAWDTVLYLRAMKRFVNQAEAAVAVGNAASNKLSTGVI